MKTTKYFILLFVSIFLATIFLQSVSAESYPIFVRPLSSGEIIPNTSFNYTFNFTTDQTCDTILLSIVTNATTDNYGYGYVNLDLENLTGTPAYLCEYRNGVYRATHEIGNSDSVLFTNWT